MYIVNLTYIKPNEVVEQYRQAHRAYLDEGYHKNYLVASGPKKLGGGGIIISHLKDLAVLEQFLKHDPFNLNEGATFEITEFSPVKHHSAFSQFV